MSTKMRERPSATSSRNLERCGNMPGKASFPKENLVGFADCHGSNLNLKRGTVAATARQELPTKKVAALLEQKQPQAKNLNPIIAKKSDPVKPNLYDLAELREQTKVKAVDMVEVVQELYPRYDKYIHSKCENGKEYGIQLRPDATKALLQRFAPEILAKPRKPNRKKSNRIQARLSDALFEELQQHLQRSGKTVQDFLEELVVRFFKPVSAPKE